MLTLFRSNQIFTSILLIFYIVFLRFTVFLAPFKWTPSGHGIFSELLYGWISSQGLVAQIVAILLLLIQGFLINVIAINNRLSNEVTLFPGLFFILLSCAIPDFLYLSPVLIGNTFFLFSLLNLFDTYKNPACADKLFNSGFWIGVASLFYFPFLFLFIFLMAGFNILRAFNIREHLMSLIGIFVPCFLTGLYFFWFDQFDFFWKQQFGRNLDFFDLGSYSGAESLFKAGVFGLLILFAVVNNNVYLQKKNIQVQKKISILYWAMAAAGIAAVFQSNLTLEHLLMLAPPMGIFLSFTFTDMKTHWAEAVHFLMLVGVIAVQLIAWLL